jgi:hypothetical protein
MKTRRGAAKKVKRASEQTPDFRHRGKTSGGGHFQGASIFREMQAFFPSVSRLTGWDRSLWAGAGQLGMWDSPRDGVGEWDGCDAPIWVR